MVSLPKTLINKDLIKTRPYNIWLGIKKRCNNPNEIGFKNYGAKGISYDPSWEYFDNFWEDMKEGYFESGTIERLDFKLGYSKTNCEWITIEQQAKNKGKYKNNELGLSNISIVQNKGIPTVKARIQESVTKRRHVKTFSLRLYKYEEAISLAEAWLEEKRKELGYSEGHGR